VCSAWCHSPRRATRSQLYQVKLMTSIFGMCTDFTGGGKMTPQDVSSQRKQYYTWSSNLTFKVMRLGSFSLILTL
jgi:hypothetical protein